MPSSTTYDTSSLQVHEAVSAWFLGPQAENSELLKELFETVLKDHVDSRNDYHPEDGCFITDEIKSSPTYQQTVKALTTKLTQLSKLLNDFSIPFYSPRYAAHMTFESSLPSIVGYIAGLLLNPNNVSFEAGPITTLLEMEVGQDLCQMIGFDEAPTGVGLEDENDGDELLRRKRKDRKSWGHLTSDGTIANLEFIWAARNLKFYPLALKEAMEPGQPLHFIAGSFLILKSPSDKKPVLFRDLTPWELLNLGQEDVLSIPDRLKEEYGISSTFMDDTMKRYVVQSAGMHNIEKRWGIEHPPKFIIAGTKHYSWPKGISLAGIGSDNIINVSVDTNARMDMHTLKKVLDNCVQNRIPVYAVVAIMGSTEQGAVDPLAKIILMRDEYRKKGLRFLVHADAAWGGYFTSTLRDPPANWAPSWPVDKPQRGARVSFDSDYVPYIALKQYTIHQLEALKHADGVTVDPHKSGYCPYPAGGLCYRDRRMRHLLTWSAPYVEHGKRGENIGVHSVEGSKPGAAAASVWMHHSVIGLHKRGHGGLLGEVSFTCARLAAHWATISDDSTPFVVVPFNKLRSEHAHGHRGDAIEAEKDFIRQKILGRSNEEIVRDPDPDVMAELKALGSDLNINAFIVNFRLPSPTTPGEWVINEDVEEANYLNQCIFDRLSISDLSRAKNPKDTPMFLSATVLKVEDYGDCLKEFKARAGLEIDSGKELFVLRNVVMSPFQAGGDFIDRMSTRFREVAEETVKHVVERNVVTPQVHTFLLHGTDKLFLVYRPLFHNANARQQLILEVQIPHRAEWEAYLEGRKAHPDSVFCLKTPVTKIADVMDCRELKCRVVADDVGFNDTLICHITISNPRIIKNRPLLSRWQDKDYDSKFIPFYLYGTPEQAHIDHMLLKAPNAQLTAENIVITSLDHPIPEDKLANGCLLYITGRPERTMQPFDRDSPPTFFYPNAQFKVIVCDDPYPAIAHGPGLATAVDHYPVIARGTIRLPLNVFRDSEMLNRRDFRENQRITTERMDERMCWEDKSAWRAMVKERLHIVRGEYYTTREERLDGYAGDGHDISKHPPSIDRQPDMEKEVKEAGLFDERSTASSKN